MKKRDGDRMKKTFIILSMLLTLSTQPSFSQGLEGIPSSVHSPEAVVEWFLSEFEYQMKIPDAPQTPQETINLRTGDCDDFALLASAALSQFGISSDVILIKFKDLEIYHAVCAWKDKDGMYNFISNRKLYRTNEPAIASAIEKFYIGWEKAIFLDELGKDTRVIKRRRT